jgi:transcriptional regulator with XRE-family HTH domain
MRTTIDPAVRADLRRLRLEANLSLGAMAVRCGLQSAASVCEWEAGHRNPSFASALAIEAALGLRVERWGYDRATGRRPVVALHTASDFGAPLPSTGTGGRS